MNDSGDIQSAREFFKVAILDRALEYQRIAKPGAEAIVADIGLIEATNWALLGTWIGYFEAQQTLELVLSAKGLILSAWSRLVQRQIVSPHSDLGRVASFEGETPVLNAALFTLNLGVDLWERNLHHDTFQRILVLTAEHVWNDEAKYFVGSIGWTDDDEWFARKNGSLLTRAGSARRIASGFANVLEYWREIYSLAAPAFNETLLLSNRDLIAVLSFVERARMLLLPGFHLDREVVKRYFSLAGEYANLNNNGSPAWLDARRDLFDDLVVVISYIAGIRLTESIADLWRLYTHPIEGLRVQREGEGEGRFEGL